MEKTVREIIEIDEDLCDGCGLCVPGCAEGAIQIIDGKARLVAENLCDGFGKCLGTCPQNAIRIIRRPSDQYDQEAVEKHLQGTAHPLPPNPEPRSTKTAARPLGSHHPHVAPSGCPGSAMRMFAARENLTPVDGLNAVASGSALTQWPVQLMLVPPTAPFLRDREIILAADCVPFALADFHRRFLQGKALLVGCPKLDDLAFYRQKLEAIFSISGCTGMTVVVMEVPCCTGLETAARESLQASGAKVYLKKVVIGIQGQVLAEVVIDRGDQTPHEG